MNKEEIIKLAQEAGLIRAGENYTEPARWGISEITDFYSRVAAAEREACAELVWPTQQFKVWSDEELTAMTGAFNRAQEKHGWYETIMAVGAVALKGRAAAIRARGNT